MKRVFIGALCALTIFLYFFLRTDRSVVDDTLVVGMFVWAPFMTINEQGGYEGFDVAVAAALAQKLNKKLEIKNLGSLAACLLALQQGKVDCVLSDLDITEERRKKLTLIPYTGGDVRSFNLVFFKQIPPNVRTLEECAGLTLCVEPGSAQERYLEQYPAIMQKKLGTVADMLMDVRYGKSNAVVLEPRIARRIQAQNAEYLLLEIPMPAAWCVYGQGIAVRPQAPELVQKITAAVAELRAEGVLAALEQRWGLL